jgi:hypothetical protein
MASDPENPEVIYVPLAGTRSQSIQRLQIGLAGLGGMALLVGLATVVKDRLQQTEAAAVPEAAANADSGSSSGANDPLADAGVAPDVAGANERSKSSGARRSPSRGQ